MGNSQAKDHWQPDDKSVECNSCRLPFTATRRRHHCRDCGYIFCSQCSSQKSTIPNKQITTPVRVCNGCFVAISSIAIAESKAKHQGKPDDHHNRADSNRPRDSGLGGSEKPPTSPVGPNHPATTLALQANYFADVRERANHLLCDIPFTAVQPVTAGEQSKNSDLPFEFCVGGDPAKVQLKLPASANSGVRLSALLTAPPPSASRVSISDDHMAGIMAAYHEIHSPAFQDFVIVF